MSETTTIAGREFRRLDKTTLRHDICTQAQIQRCGLGRLELLPAETAEDYALRTFRTAAMNGDVLLLLGHLMLADGRDYKRWQPKDADEVAAFLGAIEDDAEKAKVRILIVSFLESFLKAGLSYAVASLNAGLRESGRAGHTKTAA